MQETAGRAAPAQYSSLSSGQHSIVMAADQETVPAPMELPVHDVVNTGQETFRQGGGQAGFINVCLVREAGCQPWGFRLQGGKDRGLPFQLLKVRRQPGRPRK